MADEHIVRIFVWHQPRDKTGKRTTGDKAVIDAAEAPLSDAFRADGHTFAGELGKMYRKYVSDPGVYISIHHINR
jgi:hypothetical protein